MKKLLALVFALVLLASIVPLNSASASTVASGPRIDGVVNGVVHPKISRPSDPEEIPGLDASSFLENAVAQGIVPMLTPHSPWTIAVIDDYYGGWYYLDFQLVLSGEHCNIWVGLAPDVWTGGYKDEWDTKGTPEIDDDVFYFAYPWSYRGGAFWGAPRLRPGYRDYIFGSQLIQLMHEFDENIWVKDTSFFGMYADRPGPLNDYKIQILIFNIRDGLFWDPVHAPWFIEGYFWSYVSNLYNANIIHIDTYQWFRRQGPNPTGGDPAYYVYPPYPPSACMPYEYEGTFAHEFQHLIHRDIDPDEYSWPNEGCSELAQIICGYGFPSGHIYYYLRYFWDTSLVVWEGSLANYGAVALWTYYIYEHYGRQFIWDLVHEQANGIAGYNNVFKARGIGKDFDQVFQEWAIANYLDDTTFAKGVYGYYGLDFGTADTRYWSIPYSIEFWGLYDEVYPTGWIIPERLPYIVWYWELYDGEPEIKVYFNGDDYAGIFPHSGSYEWHSDGTAWSWFRLGQTFTIPTTGATLKFWTYYEIEEDWDYGYVEVHDLTTNEWYTLPGIGTTTTLPNPQDNPNCPDEFEPATYYEAGKWNAFTGSSGGWYEEQMSLAPFAGHTIELYFTYWTDGYTLWQGWYIDDIQIPEIGFYDDIESGPNGWTANAGWYITTGVVENDFKVNVIQQMTIYQKWDTQTIHKIAPLQLNDATEEGTELINCKSTKIVEKGPAVLVMASQPGYEHSFYTEFYFIVDEAPFALIHHWLH
jgi:hypothetical protein